MDETTDECDELRQVLSLGFSEETNRIDSVTEYTYSGAFGWKIRKGKNQRSGASYRSYYREDLHGIIGETWVNGKREVYNPEPPPPEWAERMQQIVKRPDFRKPVVPEYEKGPFFARVRKPVRIQVPSKGNYKEVTSLLARIQTYAERVHNGQFGHLIENPIFKPVFFPNYGVEIRFGKDYVNYVKANQKSGATKLYSEIFFDSEESVTKYREGNFDVGEIFKDGIERNAWKEVVFHPNGRPASYRSVVRDQLLGRQIEWNDQGEVISDVDLNFCKITFDPVKTSVKRL